MSGKPTIRLCDRWEVGSEDNFRVADNTPGTGSSAGVRDRDYSTALRKLAEAGLGLKYLQREVHRFDHAEERMKRIGFLYAEPIGNFFCEEILVRPLPCSAPKSFRGGLILYGYGSCGLFQTTFSQTLPL